jgi:hypothetical protein
MEMSPLRPHWAGCDTSGLHALVGYCVAIILPEVLTRVQSSLTVSADALTLYAGLGEICSAVKVENRFPLHSPRFSSEVQILVQ